MKQGLRFGFVRFCAKSVFNLWLVLFLLGKCCIEGGFVWSEIQFADECATFGRAVDAIHAAIFPFQRKRTAIANVVQRDDAVLELNVAVPERAEIPKTPRIGEI